jgi:hypothetical protein
VRPEDRQALVGELAADFPLFPVSTIERWADRAAAGYEAARVADPAPLVARAVRATLEELSRAGGTTSRELPLARAGMPELAGDGTIDVSDAAEEDRVRHGHHDAERRGRVGTPHLGADVGGHPRGGAPGDGARTRRG